METKAVQITVFDLQAEDCAWTAESLRAYCAACGLPADVVQFTEMQPFVLDFKDRCDAGRCYGMAFVGVDTIMGVEAARHIRGMDDLFPLFFVSRAGGDFALEACRLSALHYLFKPVTAQALETCFARLTGRCYPGRPLPLHGCKTQRPDHETPSPCEREKTEGMEI